MSPQIDLQVGAALAALAAHAPAVEPPPAGDVETRRAVLDPMLAVLSGQLPDTDVTRTSFVTTAPDGTSVPLTWFEPTGSRNGSAALYLHGGGMIVGSVQTYDRVIARYAFESGVPLLAVDYRLAPEHPHPTPVEDCYAGLVWLVDHADELGVDPDRTAVIGDSAGGGLAAGVALLALDRGGPALAQQILIYPMLDNRTTTPDPELVPTATWSYDDNVTGWTALLGDGETDPDLLAYAAPARRADLHGLPATYLDVGDLDIFRDEGLAYAGRLTASGVQVELHVHDGAPHGFDVFAPDSAVAARAVADRARRLRSL